jgi:DNA-binding IclR family transcriptional regulator
MPASQVQLVAKTLQILEALGEHENGASLKPLAQRAGLVKSTAYRILQSLRQLGYVEQSGPNGDYRLTLKLLALARQPARRPSLAAAARPHLIRLRDALGESAWLAEWRQGAVVLIEVSEAPQRLQLSYGIGDRCPLHATALGKSVVAYMNPAAREAALGKGRLEVFTRRTITSRAKLSQELARVQRRGFAVNDGETVEGAMVIGAPIFDAEGRAFAAVSASALAARLPAAKRRDMIAAVVEAASAISRELAGLGFVAEGLRQ